MRILITGGAGFIGSHLADRLLAEGHEVRALDDLDPQVHESGERPDYLDPAVELVVADVRDHDALGKAMDDADAVVHFAAAVGVGQSMYEIERYTAINSLGCAALLEEVVARRDRIGKVLVASSMSIYGEGQHANRETGEHGLAPGLRPEAQLARREWDVLAEDGTPLVPEPTSEGKQLRPTSVYAVGKRDHEELTLAVGAAYGIPAVALRFFNVYGARQALSNPYTGVLAIFAARLLNKRPPLIFEDGNQQRDFVHVTDVANACVLALESERGLGEAFNIGSGQKRTILSIAEDLAAVMNCSDVCPHVLGKYRAGDIRHCFADISHSHNELGFMPRMDFREGLAELAEWLSGQIAEDHVERAAAELEIRGLVA